MKKPKNLRRYGTLQGTARQRRKKMLEEGMWEKDTAVQFLHRQVLKVMDWFCKPLKCKLGLHVFDWTERGFG